MTTRQKLRPLPNPPGGIRGLLGGKVTKVVVPSDIKDLKSSLRKRKLVEEIEKYLPQAKRSDTFTSDRLKPRVDTRKRKGREDEDEAELPAKKLLKDRNEVALPQYLQDIVDVHSCLLKALSLHFAHNGTSVPAELGALMASTTRLWKKRAVGKDDIRRLLALYEISIEKTKSSDAPSSITFKHGKFRLYRIGTGRERFSLEYVGCGAVVAPFDETTLQRSFLQHIKTLYHYSQVLGHLRFLNGTSQDFPLINCEVHQQQAVLQGSTKQRRAEILQPAESTQHKPDSLPTTPDLCPPELNSRKSSLLSRIRARQLAKAGTHQPTAPEVLRSHALGRLEEVICTLRMMHKLKSKGGKLTKISFSMEQLEQTIRDSARVPIGKEEVEMCLQILTEEGETGWAKLVQGLGVADGKKFVVLEGAGMQVDEARKWIKQLGDKR